MPSFEPVAVFELELALQQLAEPAAAVVIAFVAAAVVAAVSFVPNSELMVESWVAVVEVALVVAVVEVHMMWVAWQPEEVGPPFVDLTHDGLQPVVVVAAAPPWDSLFVPLQLQLQPLQHFDDECCQQSWAAATAAAAVVVVSARRGEELLPPLVFGLLLALLLLSLVAAVLQQMLEVLPCG